MRTFITLLAGTTALFTAVAAQATVAYTAYDFTIAITRSTFGTPVIPYGSLSGSMTLSYDDATSVFGLAAFSMDIGTYHFDMSNTGLQYLAPGTPLIGGTENGVDHMYSNGSPDDRPDFNFFVEHQDGQVTALPFFSYETPGVSDFFSGSSTSLSATPVDAPAVPEPAAWAMMLGGFGLIGAALRQAKVRATFA